MGMDRYWKVDMDDENIDKFCSLYGMKRDEPLDLSKICGDECIATYDDTVEFAFGDGDPLFWKNGISIPSAFFEKMASDGLVFKMWCTYEESFVEEFFDACGDDFEKWIENWDIVEIDEDDGEEYEVDEDNLRENLCSGAIDLEEAKKMSKEYSSRMQDAKNDEEKAEIDEEFKDDFENLPLLGDSFCDTGRIEGESDGKEMHYYYPILQIAEEWFGDGRDNAGEVGWNFAALRGLATYHYFFIDLGVKLELKEKDAEALNDCFDW